MCADWCGRDDRTIERNGSLVEAPVDRHRFGEVLGRSRQGEQLNLTQIFDPEPCSNAGLFCTFLKRKNLFPHGLYPLS